MSQAEIDARHMAHALRLAERGNGTCWPNPSVGCVIVKDGIILGRGHTQPGGRPHAERMALAQAGAAAKGATAYVTLEPCAHHGVTSPCAEALVAAGITRVVSALTDPDPRVSGGGHRILRAAGISVTEGVMTDTAQRVTQGFLKRVTQGLPFVTLKMAGSLDGRSATASGESRWITGPLARRMVHTMRLSHDAVMVGAGTARIDDPDLSVRDILPHGAAQPLRIVLDPHLSHDPNSRLGRSAKQIPVWMVHGPDAPVAARNAWSEQGAVLLECPTTAAGHLDLTAALKLLAAKGLTRIFCEGGATLAAALLALNLVDDIAMFHAGLILGAQGHPAFGPVPYDHLAQAPRFSLYDQRVVGGDILSLWRQNDPITDQR